MLVLATILDNPGEPRADTRFRDPHLLRRLGYNGLVLYRTTALSGLLNPDTLAAGEYRRWVTELYDSVEQTISQARAAGLDVYLFVDAPALASELVGSAMTCVRESRTLCPASDELLDMTGQCIEAMIARFPDIAGIVLRLGENEAHRTPFMEGNDLYSPHCPRCSPLTKIDRLARFINYYHDLIVERLGRKLIVRAWNNRPGGVHDLPDLAGELEPRLPADRDNLVLSFKFTQTDFWRYQRWNASSLQFGDRPIIYELECQREYEGKGAMPNYQPPLWRDGMPEVAPTMGLAEAAGRVNLVGLWAWARGGGYGGPYLGPEAETWIDANVVAVPQLAKDPKANLDDLAQRWIAERLECDDPAAAEAIHAALTNSTETARQMFYIGPFAAQRPDPWHPAGNFILDDLIDAEAGWRIMQRLGEADLDEAVAEKQRAVERLARDRRAMQQTANGLGEQLGQILVHQMEYAEALAETLHDLLAAMVAYRRRQRRRDPTHVRATLDAVNRCQTHWNHHQRYANFRGTASAFRSDNLWDFTQRIADAFAG